MSDLTTPATPGSGNETAALLARLKAYLFPAGEEAARGVRGVRTTQRGELRMGRDARWNAFTAEEFVDATRTGFEWRARVGGNVLTSFVVIDAYEAGRGRLVIKKGPVQLQKMEGPEVDKGELQRYLAYVSYCPPMILNNPSLDFEAPGPHTLRVRDRGTQSGASVDIDVSDAGVPVVMRAMRGMTVGKQVTATPWTASGSEPQDHEGLRVCRHLEASWHPPEGAFTYIRLDLTSVSIVR